KAQGPENCAEIISYVSPEQFIRFLDYDIWPEDRLSLKEAIVWLKAAQIRGGLEGLAKRYKQLDEEYQIALVEQKVKVYSEEEMEDLPDHKRDSLIALPCNEAFYEVLTEDAEEEEFIIALINSFLSVDVAYAYSLLA